MLDGLAAVVGGVRAFVGLVDSRLWVVLSVVHVIDVVLVPHRLAAVVGQVLVVERLGMYRHRFFPSFRDFHPSPGWPRRQVPDGCRGQAVNNSQQFRLNLFPAVNQWADSERGRRIGG